MRLPRWPACLVVASLGWGCVHTCCSEMLPRWYGTPPKVVGWVSRCQLSDICFPFPPPVSTLSFRSMGTCPHAARCTAPSRTRAFAATGGGLPSAAPEVPSLTRPCPVTSCSAPPRPTTAPCHPGPSRRPAWEACGVSARGGQSCPHGLSGVGLLRGLEGLVYSLNYISFGGVFSLLVIFEGGKSPKVDIF